ncbi:class I SAM-dependent methyltransferase [Lysinibacillus halotolerans]|uniref:Class I SAM-dependent methyltransferase n=2 Tax=Lysinibacillus halotolerans TaxID=1368476 RepID=A0A3M8H4V0_9BACI|nr:class I SAM-dependent methyltransferase [Lysinibacillus halotolerans]
MEVLKNESISQTSHVLDVGCGTGQTAAYLGSRYGAKVTGIDIHPMMVEKAKKRIEKDQLPVEILQSSIEKAPLQDAQFDLVLSESVLSFINASTALKEIHRLLKTGGRFIAIEMTLNRPLDETEEADLQQFYEFQSILTEKDWIDLLEQTGFQSIQIHPHPSKQQDNAILEDYHFSESIEPETFEIMEQHFDMVFKYQGVLDYRIFTCTKG